MRCIRLLYYYIYFQDLLMNFSSSNNAPQSNHPTPVSQEPPSDPSSISFEQYRSPLVNSYYTPTNYATLRRSTSLAEEPEAPPSVPPLPPSPMTPHTPSSSITLGGSVVSNINVVSNVNVVATKDPSPMHFRSLQSTPVVTTKTKTINTGTHFPRERATDPPNRKRYHTAPRDKQRVNIQ